MCCGLVISRPVPLAGDKAGQWAAVLGQVSTGKDERGRWGHSWEQRSIQPGMIGIQPSRSSTES